MDEVVQRILEALTILGALFGFYILWHALSAEASAPQQAALAAMAVASVVLPYCLAAMNSRSISRRRERNRD